MFIAVLGLKHNSDVSGQECPSGQEQPVQKLNSATSFQKWFLCLEITPFAVESAQNMEKTDYPITFFQTCMGSLLLPRARALLP
jgi:hypothetical protein